MKHAVVAEKDLDDSVDFEEDFELMTGNPSKKLKKKLDQDISEDDGDFCDGLTEDDYSDDDYEGNQEMSGFCQEDDFNISSQSDNEESIQTDCIIEKKIKKGKQH